jgi:hypothetical protein
MADDDLAKMIEANIAELNAHLAQPSLHIQPGRLVGSRSRHKNVLGLLKFLPFEYAIHPRQSKTSSTRTLDEELIRSFTKAKSLMKSALEACRPTGSGDNIRLNGS